MYDRRYQKAEYGVGILKGLGLRKLYFKTYPGKTSVQTGVALDPDSARLGLSGMGHSTCPAEVDDIKAFLLEILP